MSFLAKFGETIRVFASRRPSLRELWASRDGSFDRAHAILPSDAVAGESVGMTVQAWDEYERLHDHAGTFALGATDADATHPESVTFTPADEGLVRVEGVTFETPGVQYVTLTDERGRRFVSNPVRVHESAPDERLYWGDIHLHSILSDGVGRPRKGYRFGRDVMDLDVVAYTDHDTMGFFIPPAWQQRRMRDRYVDDLRDAAEEFNDPGEYVTLFAYEWTKQPNEGGHINVYFEDADAPLFTSRDPDTDTYEKLWARLHEWREDTGKRVLAFPHHSSEAAYPFDFSSVEYDDDLAPVYEIYSQWGSSERSGADGNERPVLMGAGEVGTPGHYYQDLLKMGGRAGMMAGSDYHGPHPGHSLVHAKPHLPSLAEWREDGLGWGNIWRIWNETSSPGGLTAFRAPELTRSAIFDALATRRVYGTTQPDRILAEFAIDGVAVGEQDSTVAVDAPDAERTLSIDVAGTAPIDRVEVVKNTETWRRVAGTDDPDADLDAYRLTTELTDDAPVEGMSWDEERGTDDDAYYLRIYQTDDGMAWVGPLWVTVGT
ncbi:MAG: DUF3604 domain-containing protein [Haloarculaceae archaeon]